MNGTEPLDAIDLTLVALLILLQAALSVRLRLGLEKQVLVAAVRSVVQLLLLGFLLSWLFERESPWLVLAWMTLMGLVAGYEAVRRSSRRAPGLYPVAMGVMLISCPLKNSN